MKNDDLIIKRGKTKFQRPNDGKLIGICILILILLMTLSAFFADYYGVSFSKFDSNSLSGQLIYSVFPENIKDMRPCSSGLVLLTGSSVEYIDSSGKRLASNSHLYLQPVIRSNNSTVLLYDKGGNSFRVERAAKIYNTYTVPGAITMAELGKKNNYAYILNDDGGFQSHLFVYSYQGKKRFEWGSASDYCVAIALSPNGKSIVLALVGASNAEYYSKILFFNFNQKEPVYSIKFDDATVCELDFIDKKNICALTDNGFYTVNSDGSFNLLLDYSKTELNHSSFCYSGIKSISLAKYGNTKNSSLSVYSKDCENICVREYKTDITRLCSSKNRVAVALGNKIEVIDKNNVVTTNIDIEDECTKTVLSGKNLYALTLKGIYKFNLNMNTDALKLEKASEKSKKSLG